MQSKKFIWLIVVVLVLVVLYLVLRGRAPLTGVVPDIATQRLEAPLNPSDDVSVIEQELNATDLSGLDKELGDIEQSL